MTLSLQNRYQSELNRILKFYQLEETDKSNFEKIKVESAFGSMRNALVATAQAPSIRQAIRHPHSNTQTLQSELLPSIAALGATSIHLVTPGSGVPAIQTISTQGKPSTISDPELTELMFASAKQYPTIQSLDLYNYPGKIAGLNQTPDPNSASEPINQTFAYAIPVFDSSGYFAGLLGVTLDSSFVSKHLSSPDRAIVHKQSGFVAYPAGFGTVESLWNFARAGDDPHLTLFGYATPVSLGDSSKDWVYWTARFDTDFWSRSDVTVLRHNLVASVLTMWALLGGCVIFVSRIRRRQEDRFQGLLRNSGEIILLCNETGEILQVGGRTRQLIGWGPEQLGGVNLSLFLESESRRDFFELLGKVAATAHSTDSIQVRVEKGDRSLRWHELVVTNLRHDSEVDGIVVALRNIEAQKAGESMLIQAKESAERANHAKSEFLSRMSHELRTPLNAILGFSQLLQMGDLQEHDRESVDQVLKSGRHLLGLINDILDISRIETNHISVSKEPVYVNELLTDCINNVQLSAKERGIEIKVNAPQQVYFRADRQRIAQVVINLLSNAVKYNRDGGTVTVEVTQTQSDVYLSVQDTGNGISDELMPRLFTPFDRLGADQSTVEGTGLGLSLSKTLVEAMEGRINVMSKVGEGTKFVVALPAAAPNTTATLKLMKGFDENELRILHIDDNEVNLVLMREIFSRYNNIKLLEAREGWLGIVTAREQVPDLILLDNNLPDIDAVRVIEELRANPITKAIDIFVVSAETSSDRISACMQAGAQRYIQKPIDINDLLTAMEQNLEAA